MITLNQAIKYISEANPILGQLLNSDETLHDYCENKTMQASFDPIHLERQNLYKNLILQKIKKLFPTEDIKINVDSGLIVDTTDHHHILNRPVIIGAHLMSRFNTLIDRKNQGDFFVLDSGNVNLFEALNKRGMIIGGKHINLYPKKDKNKVVARYPLFKFDITKSAKDSGFKFTPKETETIQRFQFIIDNIDFSNCSRLSDQIVKINYYLWQEFFADNVRNDTRRCLTLEHDEILINCLSDILLKQESIIAAALFDQELREKIINRFDGIYGAWNYSGKNTGTYFFWGFDPKKGERHRMIIENNTLICPDGVIESIEITPEKISDALKNNILIPSIMTKFGFVATWMGAKLMGGSGQTEYAGKLHQAWLDILKQYDEAEYYLASKVNVNTFNGAEMTFKKDEHDQIKSCFSLDIMQNKLLDQEYIDQLKEMPVKYFLYPFIELSYYRLAPAGQREKLNCTEQELYEGFKWVK